MTVRDKSKGNKPPAPGQEELSRLREKAARKKAQPRRRISKLRVMVWLVPVGMAAGIVIGYALGLALPWQPAAPVVDMTTPQALIALQDSAVPLKPGPWGNMEELPITIEPPDEYLPVSLIEQADRRWRFTTFTQDQLLALFESAELTPAQKTELCDKSKWQFEQGAICLNPSKDLIRDLTPSARKRIFMPMINDPGNLFNSVCRSWPAARFDEVFVGSGLPPETIALIKKLSFPYGKLTFFCNLPYVLDTIQQPNLKTRLMKTLLKKSTLLLRLHVTPDTDLDELEHYWVKAGWGLDLRPMLESLSKLPKGARIDVVELFPPTPSAHIYTYAFPSLKLSDQHKDCRWTSFNFFRDVPDDRFTDSKLVAQTLATDYYPVLSDARYGDLVVLSKQNGDMIHFAVFIADDIVYTKNSGNFRDPFILAHVSDMLDHFASQIPEDETLQVRIYRNKYY